MREASSVFTSPYRYRDWTKGGVEFLPSDAKVRTVASPKAWSRRPRMICATVSRS